MNAKSRTLRFCWLVLILACGTGLAARAAEDGKLRIIVFGAHPDDCELKAGGAAALWAAQGHHVKFVSTTSGDIGHATEGGGPLAKRRTAEVKKAAELLGIATEVLDIHDGELMPTLENRRTFVRLIREWKADLVMGPRPNDYHPDHRYTGILMQDAAFMVIVPSFCLETPHLPKNPVFLYLSDNFQKPYPFTPDVVVSIDPVFDKKMEALWQLAEFLDERLAARLAGGRLLGHRHHALEVALHPEALDLRLQLSSGVADLYRPQLAKLYGPEKGAAVKHAEAFEVCEYGRRPTAEELRQLFPFFGP